MDSCVLEKMKQIKTDFHKIREHISLRQCFPSPKSARGGSDMLLGPNTGTSLKPWYNSFTDRKTQLVHSTHISELWYCWYCAKITLVPAVPPVYTPTTPHPFTPHPARLHPPAISCAPALGAPGRHPRQQLVDSCSSRPYPQLPGALPGRRGNFVLYRATSRGARGVFTGPRRWRGCATHGRCWKRLKKWVRNRRFVEVRQEAGFGVV